MVLRNCHERNLLVKMLDSIVSKSTHEWPRVTTNDHEALVTTSDHEWEFVTTRFFYYNDIIIKSLYKIKTL